MVVILALWATVDAAMLSLPKSCSQKDLGPALRLKNLEQAFSCRKLPYRMKKVLLIDDIYTTGSTAEACSRALKKAGAEQVFLLVIATSSNR